MDHVGSDDSSKDQLVPRADALDDGLKLLVENAEWKFIPIRLEFVIPGPGKYDVVAVYNGERFLLGVVHFLHVVSPPLTLDRARAIKANPTATKAVRMELQCKTCSSRLAAYTALERDPSIEAKGHIWQDELPDVFACDCNSVRYDLSILKSSMHGLLGIDNLTPAGSLDYTRQYSHGVVAETVDEFRQLIGRSPRENEVQVFLEKNPLMFSQFQASRLFVKPDVLGKFQPDFVILNVRGELVFVELERPGLKLFKVNGHPTADFNHAYEQVRDWLNEYGKHAPAILERLQVKREDVRLVKGVVLAGRSTTTNPEHLQRHSMNRAYPEIDFSTLDDLAFSVIQLSKSLA